MIAPPMRIRDHAYIPADNGSELGPPAAQGFGESNIVEGRQRIVVQGVEPDLEAWGRKCSDVVGSEPVMNFFGPESLVESRLDPAPLTRWHGLDEASHLVDTLKGSVNVRTEG